MRDWVTACQCLFFFFFLAMGGSNCIIFPFRSWIRISLFPLSPIKAAWVDTVVIILLLYACYSFFFPCPWAGRISLTLKRIPNLLHLNVFFLLPLYCIKVCLVGLAPTELSRAMMAPSGLGLGLGDGW